MSETGWRNRILSYGVKPADQFVFNPDNPRGHGPAQRKALKAALGEIGWIDVVKENVRTGYLIDGHERVLQALETNADVPYILVDLDEEEEAKALATLDPIGAMAYTNKAKIAELQERANLRAKELRDLVGQVKKNAVTVEDDYSDLPEDYVQDVPDAIFPSDNAWGVPLLNADLQAQGLELPLNRWGTVGRKTRMQGTYHFYTDDYRFEGVWADPAPLINSGCRSVVEPNFSTNALMPRAVVLWHVYRKRWLARFWQEFGVRVWVDLALDVAHRDLALLGVPKGWKSYATYTYTRDYPLEWLIGDYELAVEHAGTDQILFLVYGGDTPIEQLCRKRGWLWCSAHQQAYFRNVKPTGGESESK